MKFNTHEDAALAALDRHMLRMAYMHGGGVDGAMEPHEQFDVMSDEASASNRLRDRCASAVWALVAVAAAFLASGWLDLAVGPGAGASATVFAVVIGAVVTAGLVLAGYLISHGVPLWATVRNALR